MRGEQIWGKRLRLERGWQKVWVYFFGRWCWILHRGWTRFKHRCCRPVVVPFKWADKASHSQVSSRGPEAIDQGITRLNLFWESPARSDCKKKNKSVWLLNLQCWLFLGREKKIWSCNFSSDLLMLYTCDLKFCKMPDYIPQNFLWTLFEWGGEGCGMPLLLFVFNMTRTSAMMLAWQFYCLQMMSLDHHLGFPWWRLLSDLLWISNQSFMSFTHGCNP